MTDPTPKRLEELARRIAFQLSTPRVRDCYHSIIERPETWEFKPNGEAHGGAPYYRMGFYPDDRNLYYARGWGCSVVMWPWERWLLRSAALRACASQAGADRPETEAGHD